MAGMNSLIPINNVTDVTPRAIPGATTVATAPNSLGYKLGKGVGKVLSNPLVKKAGPIALGVDAISKLNDYKFDTGVDTSVAGTLGYLANGDFANAGNSLGQGATEAVLDVGSMGANLIDTFLPGTPASQGYDKFVKNQFGGMGMKLIGNNANVPVVAPTATAPSANPNATYLSTVPESITAPKVQQPTAQTSFFNPAISVPQATDRVGNLTSTLSGMRSFVPQGNDFILNQRQQASQALSGLLQALTNNTSTGNESWEEALGKKASRNVIKNQIATVSQLLDSANRISQDDLNSRNTLGQRELSDQRQSLYNIGNLGVQQDQNANANQLAVQRLNNDSLNSGFENRLRSIQTENAQIDNGFKTGIANLINNPTQLASLNRAQQTALLQDPVAKSFIDEALATGLPANQATAQGLQRYLGYKDQEEVNNRAKGFSAIGGNTGNFLASQTKENPKLKYNGENKTFDIEGGSAAQVIALQQKIAELEKAQAKGGIGVQKLLDKAGNVLK